MTNTQLTIATAPRANSKRWASREMTFEEFRGYLDPANPSKSKENGGVFGGRLRDGVRDRAHVEGRSMLALDADYASPLFQIEARMELDGVAHIGHSTFRHTTESPRYRLWVPLSREVTSEEYTRLCQAVMDALGTDQFDQSTDQPERFMWKPSAQNGSYEHWEADGGPLDVGAWLARTPVPEPVDSQDEYEEPAYDGASYADLSPALQAEADQHVGALVTGWRDQFAEARTWPDGVSDSKGRGWEALTRDWAWAVAMLAVTPWTGLDGDRARAVFDEVLPEEIASNPKCRGKWRHDLLKIAAGKPVEPPPWEQAALDFADVEAAHEAADDGEGFAFAKGGAFIFDTSPDPVPVWGSGSEVLHAQGEALIIAGPQGTGKTTLAQQWVLRRLGLASSPLLGFPVQRGAGTVLYLAMDRPKQAARSMRRMVTPDMRQVLDERLVIWQGPPMKDMAQNTDLLAQMCKAAGADSVVVDSLKDAAIGLSEDEVGAGWNRARQTALEAGVEVIELHHNRKKSTGDKKSGWSPTIEEIYGSVWITSGCGSVLLLEGAPGDPLVRIHHVKQPNEAVGPIQTEHDGPAGTITVFHAADPVALAKAAGVAGITAHDAAVAMFENGEPSANDVAKARRKLNSLVAKGHLEVHEEGQKGGKGGGTPTRWGTPKSDYASDYGE